ncbi:carbon monoxide dehydrogenase maturation protein [Amycolatopsis thermoflava]|uniref:carbon monoxide dehydrogenase maturation protein n=1 Tax=Amycolatopsis thermoflava TaxID=84480 RepID=UPI003D7589B8
MLIALASLKGSPGVTTLAVALAMQWPEAAHVRRLVAEMDPSGGDLAMRFGLPTTPGLVSLAAAARRTRDPAMVWKHTQALPGGARVLPAPPGGVHARAALTTLTAAPDGPLLDATAREPGVLVLGDCGRIDPGSPAESLARRADALVLVTGTYGDDLAHVATRLSALSRWTPRPALLLTGQGYPTRDVERELGVPTIGRIPHDPATAAALAGHRPPGRRRSALASSVAALARTLAAPQGSGTASSGLASVPGVPAQQVRNPAGTVTGPPDSGGFLRSPREAENASSRNGHGANGLPGREFPL